MEKWYEKYKAGIRIFRVLTRHRSTHPPLATTPPMVSEAAGSMTVFLYTLPRYKDLQNGFLGDSTLRQALHSLSIGKCISDLELIANAMEPEDMTNSVQFLAL